MKQFYKLIFVLFFLFQSIGFAQTISTFSHHSLVICANKTVKAWGINLSGQLGIGANNSINIPVSVNSLTGIVYVAAGESYSLALKNDGTIWSWGFNSNGQLGNGTATTSSNTPMPSVTLPNVIALAASRNNSFALKNDGTVWKWGGGIYSTPIQVNGLTGITAISAGDNHLMALKNDGTLWISGSNQYGTYGNGNTTSSNSPVQALSNVVAIGAGQYHSMAVKNDGTLWTWGKNDFGQLGNGSISTNTCTCVTYPTQINGLTGISKVAGGERHSIALKNDSTVFTWGNNSLGQLGIGTYVNQLSPVQVNGLTNVVSICCGQFHSIVLKSDGTIRDWGTNQFAELGNGTISPSVNAPTYPTGLCIVPTEISENKDQLSFSVFPNPSNGKFNIEVLDNTKRITGNVEITNILGQKIHSFSNTHNQTSFEINLSSYPKGIYFVNLNCNDEVYTKKIITQ